MSVRSLRSLARVALSASVARPAARTVPVLAARGPAPASSPMVTRPFTFSSRVLGNGESDSQLASVLTAEQKYEAESAEQSPETPEWLQSFRSQGVWEIVDQPGIDDVSIVRRFGNETIRLTFQVSELDDGEGVLAAEAGADAETAQAAEGEDGAATSPYITCALIITKGSHADALSIDLEAGEDGFEITNVAAFDKATAEDESSQGDWARRSRYMGPDLGYFACTQLTTMPKTVFEQLDEGLQDAFNAYLDERGVNESLAQFVLSYAEHKEQKDYIHWLQQVKSFVQQ